MGGGVGGPARELREGRGRKTCCGASAAAAALRGQLQLQHRTTQVCPWVENTLDVVCEPH